MANWYGFARSNYFRVKDIAEFKRWAAWVGCVKVIEDEEGRVGLISEDETGGWPHDWADPDGDDTPPEDVPPDREFDLEGELASHLVDGEVAILMEIGSEKMRYLTGWSSAVNSRGERVSVSLEHIYEKAKSLGSEITAAQY